jgi:hypothetical protein
LLFTFEPLLPLTPAAPLVDELSDAEPVDDELLRGLALGLCESLPPAFVLRFVFVFSFVFEL